MFKRSTLSLSRASRTFSTTSLRPTHYLDATPEVFKSTVEQGDASKVVLVDFYAEWCGPCKMLTPILKTVIPPTSSIDLLTVDTDSQQALAMQYKVSSLPTVVAFRGGKAIGKFVGARPAAQVTAFLDGLPKV